MTEQKIRADGLGSNQSFRLERIQEAQQWATLRKLSVDGYVPASSVDEELAGAIYAAFDEVTVLHSTTGWVEKFNDEGQKWKMREQVSLSHSGFFAPYYRDRNGSNTTDQKIVYQTCPAFVCEALAGGESSGHCEFYPSAVRKLDVLLNTALDAALPALTSVLEAIVRAEPALADGVYENAGLPILSIRVIKYTPDRLAGTNPHVDKSALSCILHTSDGSGQSSLVIAAPTTRRLGLSELRAPEQCDAVIIAGQAFIEAGFGLLRPTPHAVLPIGTSSPRYSLVVFCLMRGIDLTNFDTTVEVEDDLRVLRTYRAKQKVIDAVVRVGGVTI